ncbi:MAG: SsrA-binding protein SmpB [Chloroflexota bacterium]
MENRTITVNRKAYHDYIIEDSIEAGLALKGTEVKSVREGKINIRDAYAKPRDGELWLVNAHISPYQGGNRYNHHPTRDRKLLLHKREIIKLASEVSQKGLTLVPLSVYFKNKHAKVELGLVRGRKVYDKRRAIIEREERREAEKAMKSHR